MKRIKFIYVLLLLIAASCTENEMLIYENDPAVYFDKDSVNHSFFALNTSILRDTVLVRVNTMGELSEHDRPVSLVQTNTGAEEAAVAGVHYVPFDADELKQHVAVKAGTSFVEIPVILLRDESLGLKEVRLELAVAANEYFRTGIATKRTFAITTTDLAIKPALWNSVWQMCFGITWGPVKMRFIIDVTGFTGWDGYPSDYSMLWYLRDITAQKFAEYNLAHPDAPLREADGTLVEFL
jgi:hypothetical protein